MPKEHQEAVLIGQYVIADVNIKPHWTTLNLSFKGYGDDGVYFPPQSFNVSGQDLIALRDFLTKVIELAEIKTLSW